MKPGQLSRLRRMLLAVRTCEREGSAPKMRFYLDENLSPALVVAAREYGLDITDWKASRMARTDDLAQLGHATGGGRCLITTDHVDFMLLDAHFRRDGIHHAGILLLPWQPRRREFSAVAAGLAGFARAHPDGIADRLIWFDRRLWMAT